MMLPDPLPMQAAFSLPVQHCEKMLPFLFALKEYKCIPGHRKWLQTVRAYPKRILKILTFSSLRRKSSAEAGTTHVHHGRVLQTPQKVTHLRRARAI
jgi:hypothetical protein